MGAGDGVHLVVWSGTQYEPDAARVRASDGKLIDPVRIPLARSATTTCGEAVGRPAVGYANGTPPR